jgi:hypothetical protein
VFRQRLFALRDELFDIAREGAISYDHPAYGLLRTTLNGFIRFGHRVRPFSMVCIATAMQRDEIAREAVASFLKQWKVATEQLDPALCHRLASILRRTHQVVAEQLVLTSLLLVLLIVPIVAVTLANTMRVHFGQLLTKRLKVKWRQLIDRIDTTALAEGGNLQPDAS